jgi:hypothetical protein
VNVLTRMDDTLWHQTAEPFAHVGTSDPRFFDRYWFNAVAPDGRTSIQITMGAYRNMNVLDAGAVVVRDGKQHNLRASTSLGDDFDTICGPISVQVVEPLQEIRIRIDAPEHGLQADLTWTGVAPPTLENPHFEREGNRVKENYQRFDQIGAVQGTLKVAQDDVPVEHWWSCRDHSWGVRPRIGIKEPVTGPRRTLEEDGFAMAFLFYSTDRHAGHLLFSGRASDEGYLSGDLRALPDGPTAGIEGAGMEVDLYPGTRRFAKATFRANTATGEELTWVCTPLGSAVAMQGLGYYGGYDDRRGLGVWRGDDIVEHDVWDVSEPARIGYPDGSSDKHWHRIQPVSLALTTGDGETAGTGSMTLILSGKLPRYGL